jgi:DUF1680 family protein
LFALGAQLPKLKQDYPIRRVDFTDVKLEDEFWAPRLKVNRTVTIPYLFKLDEETGRADNFRLAAGLGKGKHTGKRYNDSDVFKALEAAAYSLRVNPDPGLRKSVDELVSIIGKAQEPDGYLYTTRTIDPRNPAPGAGPERWSNLRVSHELYNVGHMYEAAVALITTGGGVSSTSPSRTPTSLSAPSGRERRALRAPGGRDRAPIYRVTGKPEYLDWPGSSS